MKRVLVALATTASVFGLTMAAVTTASAEDLQPRPGCGYGDTNHAHQAAPGLDPLNLRPGKGLGDENHPHTAPPGQAPAGAGDQSSPRRGCR